jgi:hypothetical protein
MDTFTIVGYTIFVLTCLTVIVNVCCERQAKTAAQLNALRPASALLGALEAWFIWVALH